MFSLNSSKFSDILFSDCNHLEKKDIYKAYPNVCDIFPSYLIETKLRDHSFPNIVDKKTNTSCQETRIIMYK